VNRLLCILLCAILSCAAGWAEEAPRLPMKWTTPSGEVLQNPRITAWDAAFATIHHDGGIVRIAIDALPKGFPEALGYDPAAAAEARRKDQEAKAAAARAAIALQAEYRARLEEQKRAEALAAAGIQAKVRVFQVTADGGVRGSIYEMKEEMESQKERLPGTALDRAPRYQVRTVPVLKEVLRESNAIIQGVPDVVDGDLWTGVIYPAGRTQYVDSFGETITVRMYSTTPPPDMMNGGDASSALK
jgi:hypothetical protein